MADGDGGGGDDTTRPTECCSLGTKWHEMRYRVAALSAAQVANLFSSARVVPARGHSLFPPFNRSL
ncbi:hypothetical protein CN211_32800 [Sinorhizobium meliloti]|nr:hypothetical protein CN211_32800 [Sinorhizobium meliloti]